MGSQMGRAIVANSSMQLLLKQSSSAVDVLADVFKLTEEERKRLANFPVGRAYSLPAKPCSYSNCFNKTEQQLVTTGRVLPVCKRIQNSASTGQPTASAGYMNPGEYVYNKPIVLWEFTVLCGKQ